MDLSTNYLGLKLKNPIVPSSSPLMKSVDNIREMEDSGAGAIVLHSLFEEQITDEALQLHYHTVQGSESFSESLSYFPDVGDYFFGGEEYLNHIRKVKSAIQIPVIGSLNGVSTGGWLEYAKLIQDAGADALELNLYYVPTDPELDDTTLIGIYSEIIRDIRQGISIPIVIKLSPFFTSLPYVINEFKKAGANGFALFNRFYQPDYNILELEVKPNIVLSNSNDLRLALRWIAILHGRIDTSIGATTGVHTAEDAIKYLMAGANVVMVASALLKNGTGYLKTLIKDLNDWMTSREYVSVDEMIGSMSQKAVPNPAAFERALYLKELQSYKLG